MSDATFNDRFLKACRREPTDCTPVWYMRQAGRYQPEYREIRREYSLMQIVERPEVCATVTMLPVEQLGVDAAILFSDIMTPIGAMGIPFEIRANVGPCIEQPVQSRADVDRISVPVFEDCIPWVGETIGLLRQRLQVPLIGFCGAPYTLACYLIEGGPSKHYARTKALMYGDSQTWHHLMATLASGMSAYLLYQAKAGAQALQVFDSWVGSLSTADYNAFVLPHMRAMFADVQAGTDVPLIHFGVNTGHLLEKLRDAGGDVIGVDWRTPLGEAWRRLDYDVAIQGNLDPGLLSAPRDLLCERAGQVLEQIDRPGHIFNLGHGVTPNVQPETLKYLTEFVHEHTAK